MKFIVDVCVPKSVGQHLRNLGHDVVLAAEAAPFLDDVLLLDWCRREGRILVTNDKDFGYHIFIERQEHAGLIRLPNAPRSFLFLALDTILTEHSGDLKDHAVITVTPKKFRMRRT